MPGNTFAAGPWPRRAGPARTYFPDRLSRHHLTLLGRLGLEGDSTELEALLARRRLLALLAVLGASGRGGVSRDSLLLYFWPESTASKARNSLNQALHALRRDLGKDAILGTHELRLNPEVITCDYSEFISAAEDCQYERAVALHRGRLLEGFSLANAPEWESWLARERARETRVHCHAVEQLARAAEKSGDLQLASRWWCRLADIEPLSSRAVTHAMRALAASGDRSGAITRGERYVRDVREEIEADPDPSVTALMAEIRRFTPRSEPALVERVEQTSDSEELPVFEVAARQVGDRAVAGEDGSRKRRYYALAAAATLLAVLGAGWTLSARTFGSGATAGPLVVVEKVSTAGASSDDGAALSGFMAAAIDGVLGLRAVVAAPGELGGATRKARVYRVVTELVRQSTGPIRGSAVVLDGPSGRPIAWATSTDEAGDVFRLMDDLTRQVLLNVAARELGVHSSAVVTSDLHALQAYLDGEGRLRAGQHAAAVEAFTRATSLDSSFGYAYYRLGTAAELTGRDGVARAAFDAASRNATALPAFERAMIEAARVLRSGRPFEAEQRYGEIIAEYPDAVDAWRELSWLTFYNSPLRGRPVSDARPALQRVLQLKPEDPEALIYLARTAALDGRARDAAALRGRVAATGVPTVQNRAFRFLALADPAGVKRVTRALLATPSRLLDSVALASVVSPEPAAVEQLGRALSTPEPPRDAQGFGFRLLAQALLARGRTREAVLALDSAVAFDTAMALEVRALYVSTPDLGFQTADVAAARAALERWDPGTEPDSTVHSEAHRGLHPAMREYLLGRLALAAGDAAAAARHAQSLQGMPADQLIAPRIATLAASLRAHLAFRRGAHLEALQHLDRADWPGAANVFIAEAGDRLLRAQILERLGRGEEARAWYRSLAQRTSYELVYLGLAEHGLARIAERRGDMQAARGHYRRVSELYAGADRGLAALAAEAARRTN